jgi:hypothetical protein
MGVVLLCGGTGVGAVGAIRFNGIEFNREVRACGRRI